LTNLFQDTPVNLRYSQVIDLMDQTILHYHQNASQYQSQYDSVFAEDVHADWSSILRKMKPGLALDIGAGSGRDALWLAEAGWEVTAVEPAEALRAFGNQKTADKVNWIDAQLPDLIGLQKPNNGYDLILLSAVWMHLNPAKRLLAMETLSYYLSAAGNLIITLRFGPSDPNRPMYEIDLKEIENLAKQHNLILHELGQAPAGDLLARKEITWKTVCLNTIY
jgi:SAM-dependent methyltransferase